MMNQSKQQVKQRIRIAVPRHLMSAVKRTIQQENIQSRLQVLDVEKNPKNVALRYECFEEDNGRFHFSIRGTVSLMNDDLIVEHILRQADEIITCVEDLSGDLEWDMTVNFLQA